MALHLATGSRSAVSREADDVRRSAYAIVESAERSFAQFGPKNGVISAIHSVASECAADGWDGEDGAGIAPIVVSQAIAFVRSLPAGGPLPEVASEPDGSISFDWIASRTRVVSVSVGTTNRLAFAWIDGTDRGHGVARFDGDSIPARILESIREITDERTVALGAA